MYLLLFILFLISILIILSYMEYKDGKYHKLTTALYGVIKEIIYDNCTAQNDITEFYPRALDELEWCNFERNLKNYFTHIEYDTSGYDGNTSWCRFVVKKTEISISTKDTIKFVQTSLKKYIISLGANANFTFSIKATISNNLLYFTYATSPEGKAILEKN